MNNTDINRILQVMLSYKENISDLHFYVGRPPQVEVAGNLMAVPIKGLERLTPYQLDLIAVSILGDDREAIRKYQKQGATDFSYSIPGTTRFRANIYKQRGTTAIVMRVIPYGIPSIKELNLPDVLFQVAEETNGIVLVTGPTGSGKSTTIAAIVDQINQKHPYHIVTIEDPIEYLYRHKVASICQRELGADTTSFSAALRAALRQSPKVIVVGEMRDVETAEIALEAAETGHLVFSTLHTIDASKAIDRIIGIFPQTEEQQIRNRFAQTFRWVISQRLVPKKGGGRVAALEVLKSTSRTREYILKGESESRSLADAMTDGYLEGMQTFDGELIRMVRTGSIEKDVALRYSSNPTNLALELQTMPSEEQMSIVWENLVSMEDLTASDILRVPDAIGQMMEEADPEDIDRLSKKVLGYLNTGEPREKMAVINVLPSLVSLLSDHPKWKNIEVSISMLVNRCFQKETDEEVIYTYLHYFQSAFSHSFYTKNYADCAEMLRSIDSQLQQNEKYRRAFSQGIDSLRQIFTQEIKNGSDGADAAIEYLNMAGDRGAEFLFDWLVEEEDRFTRVRLLNYIERLNRDYLAHQIEKRLGDYRWYVVRNMITILTKVNLPQSSTFIKLVADHEDPRIAKEILKKLYQQSTPNDAPIVMQFLNHRDRTVRVQAIHLAPTLNLDKALPMLLRLASGTNPADTDLRAAAFQALAKMGSHDALPLAQKVLEKKAQSKVEIPERNAAVKLIGELAGDASRSLLQKIASSDANQETRTIAANYLQ